MTEELSITFDGDGEELSPQALDEMLQEHRYTQAVRVFEEYDGPTFGLSREQFIERIEWVMEVCIQPPLWQASHLVYHQGEKYEFGITIG